TLDYTVRRPVTPIRNRHPDGNDATARDPSSTPFIDTPMHPEYPCAHCIVSAAVGTVLQAEIGTGPLPTLTTTSPTAKGVARSWTTMTTSCRRWRRRASTTACTTATPRKSARPWANRLASWQRRSTCGRPSSTHKLGALALEGQPGADSDASVSQVLLAESGPNHGVQATAYSLRSYVAAAFSRA